MSTKITRINQIAKEKPQEVFTSIYHLINYELLKECFKELDGNKATGLDNVTKDMYFMNLDENLNNIVERLKTKSYRPSPARKVNILKANGKLRGLAISNFEDKIVQLAVKKLVEAIFEPKFTNNMFGFRPNKSCHDCLKYLTWCIEKRYTNYILDADIKGYFDNINHDLIMKALEMHIKDTNLLRLIKRFLKAGIMENGKHIRSEYGTPQGSILSPVLANIVMYYGIILYVEKLKKVSRGYIEIINYADDMVLCLQYKEDAIKVYNLLKERLKKLGLEFAEEKTRLIEFGRFASENCKKNGKRKPDSFDFLGFTHYCGTSHKTGRFRVKRKTSKKKFKQKIQEYKVWIKENRNKPLREIMLTMKKKLIGHFNYYGITDNQESLLRFQLETRKLLFKWLNRRSQKKSYNWIGFNQMLEHYKLPLPKIKVNVYAI
ncbi:MAG: group II intron reverse transcriptase/maturase [Bacilli bacterium]|nr:group II intron reverse transcriptase/maturase [Bacilli bacterium]